MTDSRLLNNWFASLLIAVTLTLTAPLWIGPLFLWVWWMDSHSWARRDPGPIPNRGFPW